jgi:apolipoprotein N-acyltransferase
MARDSGSDAAAGVFAVGFAFVFVAVLAHEPLWLWLAGPLMLGPLVATARRRRTGPDPEVTLGPGRQGRPWRKRPPVA